MWLFLATAEASLRAAAQNGYCEGPLETERGEALKPQPKKNSPSPQLALGSKSGETYVSVRFSKRFLLRALALLASATLVVALSAWGISKLVGRELGEMGTSFDLAPGPWGKLTAKPILIEAPSSLLSTDFALGDNRWYFRAETREQVEEMLRADGLPAALVARISSGLAPATAHPGFLCIEPPEELVLSLSPEERSSLYGQLAQWPENFAQAEPFRTTDLHEGHWLQPPLPRELIKEVQGLFWRRGKSVLFSDYNIIARRITDTKTKLELLKQLTRKASMVVLIHVPGGGDVDSLVDYWGTNGREEKVRPILAALSRSGGGDLGMSNLLPAFARQRLYRYADRLPGTELSPDCHWNSFNFFTQGAPDDSLQGVAGVERALREKYQKVDGDPKFGDVILLMRPDGTAIHSAVYIADSIVYTKNGPSLAAPYVLSTIDDMLAFYPSSDHISLSYFRRHAP